ncbi:hypothetical protein C942_04276 [Photobacterium marinum]|uniref:Cyclase n=1 Tax=Photobacterium marinum TaxID=1056511 RepID=L8JE80_9GAMM|nr:cyclase family protein [Photobacterium marinum]ELR66578.1 hypothetical protein C942_04276 [Photobacterium marinum]
MTKTSISIEITESHPAYQWAKRQSDSVNAMGHIGTHIDCYTTTPEQHRYTPDAVMLDCSDSMPDIKIVSAMPLKGKALVLYTANLEKNGYGNNAYGKQDTALHSDVLDAILEKSPAFIVIDSYGIGAHGEQHRNFDERCEQHNCFVIENVALTHAMMDTLTALEIEFDTTSASTGKRCEVIAVLSK